MAYNHRRGLYTNNFDLLWMHAKLIGRNCWIYNRCGSEYHTHGRRFAREVDRLKRIYGTRTPRFVEPNAIPRVHVTRSDTRQERQSDQGRAADAMSHRWVEALPPKVVHVDDYMTFVLGSHIAPQY